MKNLYGFVDLLNALEGVSDVMVDTQVSSNRLFDQPGHLRARLEAPESSTFPNAASDQLEWASLDFVPCRRHADDYALAPTPVCTLKGSTHDVHIACCIKGDSEERLQYYA